MKKAHSCEPSSGCSNRFSRARDKTLAAISANTKEMESLSLFADLSRVQRHTQARPRGVCSYRSRRKQAASLLDDRHGVDRLSESALQGASKSDQLLVRIRRVLRTGRLAIRIRRIQRT